MRDLSGTRPKADPVLGCHPNGSWYKKRKGKPYYFGRWRGAHAIPYRDAVSRYVDALPGIDAGRPVGDLLPETGALTVFEIFSQWLDSFLNGDGQPVDIQADTWADYKTCAERVLTHIPNALAAQEVGPADFAKIRTSLVNEKLGLYRLDMHVAITKMAFTWAADMQLIDRPPAFGKKFRVSSKKQKRQHKRKQPSKLFPAEHLRKVIAWAGENRPDLECWLLLGLNCGYKAADISALTRRAVEAIDDKRRILNESRAKSGSEHVNHLWPETLEALRRESAARPKPQKSEFTKLALLTDVGGQLVRPRPTYYSHPYSVLEQVHRKLGLTTPGLTFSSLKHTAETIGGGCGDQVAVDLAMGHIDGSIAAVYRQGHHKGDERLKRVSDEIRQWLWPDEWCVK